MLPDERPTLSTPAPVVMPSSISSPHTPAPENQKYVTDFPQPVGPPPPPNVPPKRGGRIASMLLILVLLIGCGALGYLWYKERQKNTAVVPVETTATPTPQLLTDTMQLKQVLSTTSDGKTKNYLTSTLTAPIGYRLQSQLNPDLRVGTGGYAYWQFSLADGFQDKPTGARTGTIIAIDVTAWQKADDVGQAGVSYTVDPFSIFGGPYKAADKQAMVTNLEVLLSAKETTASKYLPDTKNKVLFPFTSNTTSAQWRKVDLVTAKGWTGYTTIGQQRQNDGYNPHLYALMLTTVKDINGTDKKILVAADIAVLDSLSQKILANGDQTPYADEIKSANSAVAKDNVYGSEAEAIYKKLVDVLNSLKVEVSSS